MRLSLDLSNEESDGESDDEDEYVYDSNCNTVMDRRGHLRSCKTMLTTKILEANGWQHLATSGRNSHIFRRRGLVLKIVKHASMRNTYCPETLERIERIRLLCDNMGTLAPRVRQMRICNWNGEPALTMLMRDEGDTGVPRPSVTDAQIDGVVHRLVHSGIISNDIVTETSRINVGNLALRLSPKGRVLTVRFLDVDVPENFMNTLRVPPELLKSIWRKVILACLGRPTEPITYHERDALVSWWSPLFTRTTTR